MSLRYQLRRELGFVSSKAALGIAFASGSGGGAGFPFGGGGGASQVMMGVAASAGVELAGARTPSSWP